MVLLSRQRQKTDIPFSWKIPRRSSSRRAREYRTLLAGLLLISSLARADDDLEASYEFNIRSQPADLALTEFAEQADLTLVFPDELVLDKQANALIGRYTLQEGVDVLLDGTGLTPQFSNEIVLTITTDEQSASGGRPMKSGKKAGLIAILAGAFAGGVNAQDPNTPTEATGPRSEVRGKVADFVSGANLKGALVEIEETGQTTSTDDLGEFRFPAVAQGEYTLRVSYLGYAEGSSDITTTDGQAVVANFKLSGAGVLEEITVYGTRSARAQALNQERAADNISTVLSDDLLGQFEGATIAEALRRVPGVAFEEDPVTGDGTNVIIRGLVPHYNMVTLNGLRLPEGSGTGRSPSLNNILTDSIAKVTISKSLLPNQDSAGTGGLIDIETKAPLDRPRRFFSFGADHSLAGDDFLDEYSVNGTVAGTFGENDNLGLSASVQYREREIQRYNYFVVLNNKFRYLPLDENGEPITSPFQIDPNTLFPFEVGVDEVFPDSVVSSYNGAESTNLAVTISGQWRIADHTDMRLDYTRAKTVRDEYSRSTTLNPWEQYDLLPIDELGGEVRGALNTHDVFASIGFPGTFLPAGQIYSFRKDVETITDTYSFRGTTELGPWALDYTLGYADGSTAVPINGQLNISWEDSTFNLFQADELSDAAFQYVTSDGRPISLFAPLVGNEYPIALLNQAGFARLADPSEWFLSSTNGAEIGTSDGGSNPRYTAKASARYDFEDSHLKYLEAGFFYENAEFRSAPILSDQRYRVLPVSLDTDVSLADLGLAFSGTSLEAIGIDGGPDVVSREAIENFFVNIADILASNPNLTRSFLSPADPRFQETFTEERNLDFYLMARAGFGKLEVVGGARFDQVDIDTRGIASPQLYDENNVYDAAFADTYAELADSAGSESRILPRVAMTYRQTDNLLFRAGYGMTVGRPRIQNLSGTQSLLFRLRPDFGPNGDQPLLDVRKTNPDLEPSVTHNYDLSVEHYFSDIGQIKVSVFYKEIDNLLGFVTSEQSDNLEGVTIPADPRLADLSGFFIQVIQPENGVNRGTIHGYEIAYEQRFPQLPGVFSGLGVYANYTHTEGERQRSRVRNGENIVESFPLSGSPEHSGTVAVTYNQYGFDASLAYTAQGRRFVSFRDFGFDAYQEADSSLDLRVEYRFDRGPGTWRVWLEGSDLLKGTDDADVITTQGGVDGVPKLYTGGNYYGGRHFALGLAATF